MREIEKLLSQNMNDISAYTPLSMPVGMKSMENRNEVVDMNQTPEESSVVSEGNLDETVVIGDDDDTNDDIEVDYGDGVSLSPN